MLPASRDVPADGGGRSDERLWRKAALLFGCLKMNYFFVCFVFTTAAFMSAVICIFTLPLEGGRRLSDQLIEPRKKVRVDAAVEHRHQKTTV